MSWKFERPTGSTIATYLHLVAERQPATRVLDEEHIQYGIGIEAGWADASSFAKMIVDLGCTPIDAPPLWLRTGEVFLRTNGRLPRRHCAWGKYSKTGEMCMKPVVHASFCWGLDVAGERGSQYFDYNHGFMIDGWRHLDGTELHQQEGTMYGPDMWACDPVPLCNDCGQEFLSNHCPKCHVNGALKTTMEAYGNATRCTTIGCDYNDWYSIGD